MLREYANVPSPLYEAHRFSEAVGARILLKREDLNHTGAHKIRNVIGQALLAKRIGKPRAIAETGAGQHGVASATACAYLDLECTVYMGEVDTERQALNVARMKMLGAEVVSVTSGSRTLKDAINEALRDWVASVDTTSYLFGTAAGPHPFPTMVRDLTRGIGDEARRPGARARRDACPTRPSPASVAAPTRSACSRRSSTTPTCGSSASRPAATASRPVATPRPSPAATSACCTAPARSCCRTRTARRIESHSISAGLDYPGVGPEHAYLADIGRAAYVPATDAAGDVGVRPAVQDRGHHPGDRVRARPGRRASTWPRRSVPTRRSWSTCRAAATRTCTRPRSTSACSTSRSSWSRGSSE